MVVVTGGSKKRRLEEEEDRISRLPDDLLGAIVSLLPTRDGARTQVLSSQWRPVWRSAPLNLDTTASRLRNPVRIISGILSSHQGPGRRLSISINPTGRCCKSYPNDIGGWATALDGWLQSPALHNLQELDLYPPLWRTPLPASVHRFSSTLAVARFVKFDFPDGYTCRFSVLTQLTLEHVRISECSLHALLAGCPVLVTLLLLRNHGFRCFKIVSPSLRRIGVCPDRSLGMIEANPINLELLVVEEAPYLERLHFDGSDTKKKKVEISVCSAPRFIHFSTNLYYQGLPDGVNITVVDVVPSVKVLALSQKNLCLETVLTFIKVFPHIEKLYIQGLPDGVNITVVDVVPSVKVLALSQINLCLETVITFIKVFPHMEKLYIQTSDVGEKNTWCRKYRKLIGTLDICLRKIMMTPYRGNTSHVNFAKFFVSNASLLETMRLEVDAKNLNNGRWIDRQHRLLQVKKRDMLDFVSREALDYNPFQLQNTRQVHDMSIEPFHRFSFL